MPSTWRNSLQVFVQLILSVILQGSYYKGGSAAENLPATAGDLGSVLGSGRSPEGWNGNPLQYSSWEISWTEEPGVLQAMRLQSWTRLSDYTATAAARMRKPSIPHEGAEARKDGVQSIGDRRRPCNKAVRFQNHAPNMPDEARFALYHDLFSTFP